MIKLMKSFVSVFALRSLALHRFSLAIAAIRYSGGRRFFFTVVVSERRLGIAELSGFHGGGGGGVLRHGTRFGRGKEREATEWTRGARGEPVIDAVYVERVTARRNLLKPLLRFVLSKAHRTPAFGFPK